MHRRNASALQAANRDRTSLNYNDRCSLLRYAAVLTLVVWVGGLLALGAIAAPAIFDVLARAARVRRPAARRRRLRRDPAPLPPGQLRRRRVLLLTLVVRGDPRPAPAPLRLARRHSPLVMLAASRLQRPGRRVAHRAAAARDRRRAVEPAAERSAARRVRPAARAVDRPAAGAAPRRADADVTGK